MKCDKTDPLLYLSARVGVLSAALPSWEELMRRPEREEAAPERQDALPLREDAQTVRCWNLWPGARGGPLWICSAFPLTVTTQRFCLKER